ncbi:hypothetical protein Ccrd_013157 [Cynara cardunculus var. scolymus]|uniref:ER membrane protein complex subunit 10 n=1 Tax=Cynara cardunculus var. scolymus TaxID=59895 RepID=A0A103YG41_CYNCS|nr:hypothetical protein Ccrd_013157 [Cynara cardunculus var. scolymus]
MKPTVALLLLSFTLLFSLFSAFQSDELLVDDEQFGLGKRPSPELDLSISSSSPSIPSRSHSPPKPIRKRSADSNSDSRVQFALEHAFGDSDDFSTAGTFTARLKTYGGHGTLTKLRFTRNDLSTIEQEKFKKLLENDDFYTIRVPSDVLNPPGRDYVISSVKARCLPNDGLDENFIIHMPAKWSFNSHAVLKYSEQAPRRPMFSEDIGSGEMGEDEGWMYFIPLVIIVVNAFTQAMNMPEEQASAQTQQPVGAAMQRR